jgi:hypothetical protein
MKKKRQVAVLNANSVLAQRNLHILFAVTASGFEHQGYSRERERKHIYGRAYARPDACLWSIGLKKLKIKNALGWRETRAGLRA